MADEETLGPGEDVAGWVGPPRSPHDTEAACKRVRRKRDAGQQRRNDCYAHISARGANDWKWPVQARRLRRC